MVALAACVVALRSDEKKRDMSRVASVRCEDSPRIWYALKKHTAFGVPGGNLVTIRHMREGYATSLLHNVVWGKIIYFSSR